MNKKDQKKVLLIILDGWGLSPIEEGNAPYLAKTPVLDFCYANYPKTSIAASGLEVGLNRGEMGNSEVGHLNLGTGRVVWENLPRISYAIEQNQLGDNKNLLKVLDNAKNKKLHLIGLVSEGGVHSHLDHLIALIKIAKSKKVEDICIHFISDGRDTSPKVAMDTVGELESEIKKIRAGKIVSLVGRYFAMDRDKRWDRTKKAYELFVSGKGEKFSNVSSAIEESYKQGQDDEFITPKIIDEKGVVGEGDSVIFYNFRADRMRQLVEALVEKSFSRFDREKFVHTDAVTMTMYDRHFALPVLFDPINMENYLAKVLEDNNVRQYHVAETEKYPHVTYFFNGGVERIHRGEKQVVVPSPRVATYDKKPEMSAFLVAEKVTGAIKSSYDFIVVNFANGDMVGHTGILKAGILACEAVDECLNKVLSTASSENYQVLIIADHGNCEIMIDPATGAVNKEHTTNPVPFVYLDFKNNPFNFSVKKVISKERLFEYSSKATTGVLSDITGTVLSLLEVNIPPQITETNLTKLI